MGLAVTHLEPSANHVWRIVSRHSMRDMGLTDTAVVCMHDQWMDIPPDDDDSILLTKQYMHHMNVSQEPMLLLPAAVASALSIEDLKPMPVCDLGFTVRGEFMKTAAFVSAVLLLLNARLSSSGQQHHPDCHDCAEHPEKAWHD